MAEEDIREGEEPAEVEEAEPEAAAGEEEPGEGTGEEEGEQKPKKKPASQRIRELTAKYRQTEREVQELRRLLNERGESQKDYQQPQTPKKPNREDYDDEDQYFEALADYKAEAKLSERDQKQQQETERQKREREQQEISQKIDNLNSQGEKEFDDYDDVVLDNQDLQISDTMVQSITEMENGHKVAYHLGHNPDKAAEIAQKSPYKQAIELAKIEEQLSKGKTKKTTKAPPPTSSVKGQGDGADPEPSDPDAWINWRYRQLQKKKGA